MENSGLPAHDVWIEYTAEDAERERQEMCIRDSGNPAVRPERRAECDCDHSSRRGWNRIAGLGRHAAANVSALGRKAGIRAVSYTHLDVYKRQGKTSVVAGLISALREYDWTAVKITQYGHGVCSANGAPCDCATVDHTWAITEEKDRGGESDTSRFLVAGAARTLWVRTEQGRLAEAMPALRQRLEHSRHVMVESNSVLKFMRPDLYLTVLDPGTEDFKNSAREFLDRADAVILHDLSLIHI